jgi:hypothetical protein
VACAAVLAVVHTGSTAQSLWLLLGGDVLHTVVVLLCTSAASALRPIASQLVDISSKPSTSSPIYLTIGPSLLSVVPLHCRAVAALVPIKSGEVVIWSAVPARTQFRCPSERRKLRCRPLRLSQFGVRHPRTYFAASLRRCVQSQLSSLTTS